MLGGHVSVWSGVFDFGDFRVVGPGPGTASRDVHVSQLQLDQRVHVFSVAMADLMNTVGASI